MAKKMYFFVAGLLLLYCKINAQELQCVSLKFERDDRAIRVRSLSVLCVVDNKTIKLKANRKGIFIPKSIRGEKGVLTFVINKKKITFHQVPIVWNDNNLVWTLGEDNDPINREKIQVLPDQKKIYYLNYGTGVIVAEPAEN